jgi:PAS domain S-box-containing protein
MSRLTDLPIRTKFIGLMSLLLLVLLAVSGIFTYQRQKSFIIRFAVDNARMFATELIETREYMSSVVRGEPEHNYNLVPQVVATQVAKRVTQNSKFYVRQVSLRYRNPLNRPDPYETEKLEQFRTGPRGETYDVVKTGGTTLFRYLQPMIATASCLECHGSYQSAPDFVRKRFPPGHYSYNYKVGEVIGAVSVTIPMKELYAQLGANFLLDVVAKGLIFLIVVIVMGAIISREMIKPVRMLSDSITRVARTGDFHEKLPQKSRDEIGMLVAAFNELMDELSRRTVQSRESEDRYRRFIEVAASAVVTFMRDGKILIANQKAESLFRRSRQELLGESIFSYLEDGPALRDSFTSGTEVTEEVTTRKIRDASGKVTEVEMVVSASKTDKEPMFTAILREKRDS